MRLKLCAVLACVFALSIGGLTSSLFAGAIPGITSLQDLINLGPSQGSGIQIGNDIFYNFSYAGSPVPPNPGAPTPSTILVTSTNTGTGLRFAFPWTSTQASNESSNISYSVHVATSVPQQFINSATLNMQSSVSALSLADNASTTTAFSDPTTLVTFAQQNVANASVNPAQVFTNNLALSPTRDFSVSDGIIVHSGTGGGTASVTYVENIFSQVPEPTSLTLLAGLSIFLTRSRRRA